eukprot:113214_1
MVQDEFNPKQNNKTSIQIAFTFPINAHNDPLSTFFPNFSDYSLHHHPNMEHIAHHIPKCQSSKTPSLFERVHIAHHMTFQNAQIPKCHRYLGLSLSHIT